jgi:hypothetical protein
MREIKKSTRLVDSKGGALFAARSASVINPLAGLQLPCPSAQPLTCVASCAAGSSPAAQDCAAEITKRLQPDDTINSGSCNNSSGPEPTCSASGNFCNSKTGTRGTISVSLVCNPVPPPPPAPPDGCSSSALQECLYLGEPYRWVIRQLHTATGTPRRRIQKRLSSLNRIRQANQWW